MKYLLIQTNKKYSFYKFAKMIFIQLFGKTAVPTLKQKFEVLYRTCEKACYWSLPAEWELEGAEHGLATYPSDPASAQESVNTIFTFWL